MQQAKHILKSIFGYGGFRHQQQDVIQTLLDGRDALVLMPTGGGKSLCYQIPALMREGITIVVSPLIALMQDQVDSLKQLGVKAAFINSSQTELETEQVKQQMLSATLDIIYIAPERLITDSMLGLLSQCRLALFAVDEAHCVSQWGHDFRPVYQQLKILHQRYPDIPRVALTATADKRTQQEIIKQLDLADARLFINSFDRPNIHYAISQSNNAKQQLWRFLQENHAEDAGIVYCLSRKKVEAIAQWLTEQGREALPYHAGLPQSQRQQNQQRFLREDKLIIVATIAFGMGIDKPDVRFVAHLSLPKSVEAYYQETGRAGRDGQIANAWMVYGLQDVLTLRQFMRDSNAEERYKQIEHQKLESMLGLCELITCRRQSLLAYFDEQIEQQCGRCDNCISPPEQWDATESAQKALSCVFRTGQRFGVNYLINTLLGKEDDRIIQYGHHTLSTFGIGKALSNHEWHSVFRQLLTLGYIDSDVEKFGALILTEKSRPLLSGTQNLMLRKPAKQESTVKKKAQKGDVKPQDIPLWEALKAQRLDLAQEYGVPPYVIFHDATLLEIVRQRPSTMADMSKISGVGQQKLQRYGKFFLEEVKRYPLAALLQNNLSATINETLMLLQQGSSPSEIAKQRELSLSTVYNHLAGAIEVGLITAMDVISLKEAEYKSIVAMIESFDTEEQGRLKPVYDAFEGEYDYGVIRCIQASL